MNDERDVSTDPKRRILPATADALTCAYCGATRPASALKPIGGSVACVTCLLEWLVGAGPLDFVPESYAFPSANDGGAMPKTVFQTKTNGAPTGVTAVSDPIAAFEADATAAVATVDAIPNGDAFETAVEAAQAALLTLHAAATAIVFPATLAPVSGPTLMDFGLLIDAWRGDDPITKQGIERHQQALDGEHLELAAILRSPRFTGLVRRRAREAVGSGQGAEAETKAAGKFSREIAGQLDRRDLLRPASTILASRLPALHDQLAAVTARHREATQAAGEAARLEAERTAAAERAAADAVRRAAWAATLASESRETRDRRESLRDYFRRNGRFTFPIGGADMTGDECADALDGGDEFTKYFRAQSSGSAPAGRQ